MLQGKRKGRHLKWRGEGLTCMPINGKTGSKMRKRGGKRRERRREKNREREREREREYLNVLQTMKGKFLLKKKHIKTWHLNHKFGRHKRLPTVIRVTRRVKDDDRTGRGS